MPSKVDIIPGLGALKDFIKDPIKDFLLTLGKKSGTPPVEEFSPSLKAAEALKQEKGPYEQLKATMINKHGAKEAEMDWSGANDLFAGKTVTKSDLVVYLSGGEKTNDLDPTDLVKENTNVAKGLMLELPKLTRVLSKSAPASEFFPISRTMSGGEIAMGLPSPKQLENFRSQVRYFVAEEGRDKPIQGSDFYDSLDEALDVSDRINDKRLQMSGITSGQEVVPPDELTYTQDNFPLGGTDTAETVYRFDDPTGLYDNAFSASHKFNELPDDNVLAHTRTAQFPVVDGGTGYHVGEIQSDVLQNQRRVTKLGRAPGEELRSRSEELALREKYDNIDLKALVDDIEKRANELFNKRLNFKKNFNLEYQNAGREEGIQAGKDFVEAVKNSDRSISNEAVKAIVDDLIKKYTPKELDNVQISNLILYPENFFDEIRYAGGTNSEGAQKRIKQIQGIREKFKDEIADFNEKNKIYEILKKQKDIAINIQRSGKTDQFKQLPYGESTNQWVDMVLRKELAKAIDSGSEFMTIPSSDLVRKYTQGSEEGQGKFYDQIVPMRLNKLAKKYDPNISVIPQKIKTQAGEENVTALPLTQKLIDNIMNKGLPKYAVPITGGSLGALSFVEGEQQ